MSITVNFDGIETIVTHIKIVGMHPQPIRQFAADHGCSEDDAWFCFDGKTERAGAERLRQLREQEERADYERERVL